MSPVVIDVLNICHSVFSRSHFSNTGGFLQVLDNLVDELLTKRQSPSPKRKRRTSLIGTMFEPGTGKGAALPRFVIIKRIEGTFEQISPFLIQKLVDSQVGKINQIRKVIHDLICRLGQFLGYFGQFHFGISNQLLGLYGVSA